MQSQQAPQSSNTATGEPTKDLQDGRPRSAVSISENPDSTSFDMPKYRCLPTTSQDALTSNAIAFHFLAEGAANTVFQLRPWSAEEEMGFLFTDDEGGILPREQFLSRVIRIAKGIPKTLTYQDIRSGFENDIKPLFLVDATLESENSLQSSDDVARSGVNGSPPVSFEQFLMEDDGVFLPQSVLEHLHDVTVRHSTRPVPTLESRAILLPDMSSKPGSEVTIEIKPKWLAQSPNAPQDAYVCRTCALQASRKLGAGVLHKPFVCPLQLVAGNTKAIARYLKPRIIKQLGEQGSDDTVAAVLTRLVPFLTSGPGNDLLKHLRTLQEQHDPEGVLTQSSDNTEQRNRRLRLAMTLRDCSLFIKIPFLDESLPIDAKLGDLDFKSADKIADWAHKESGLISGGWYADRGLQASQCLVAEGQQERVM